MPNSLLYWEPKSNLEPLHLTEDALSVEWLSEIKEVDAFKRLVVSWNTKTFIHTTSEVWIRVRTANGWSMWFSYGKWTTDGMNTGSFSGQKDSIAQLSIDELIITQGYGEAIQIKATLTRKNAYDQTPILYKIFASLSSSEKEMPHIPENLSVNLEVPMRSQLLVDGIGNIICSPTSVAMVLEFYGCMLSTEDVAKGTIDNGTSIYGNWSYNVAYASECGFSAFVSYCQSFDDILYYLKQGKPLVASIKTDTVEELPGADQSYPSGHLVVIRGFEAGSEGAFVLVNDPATKSLERVFRRYPYDAFVKAWRHLIYVIERY